MKNLFKLIKFLKQDDIDGLLIGGCVRDLFFNTSPKDYDLVVTNQSYENIKLKTKKIKERKSHISFYGNYNNFIIDVWPISSSLLFNNKCSYSPSLNNITKTTFLSINAIGFNIKNSNFIIEPIFLKSLINNKIYKNYNYYLHNKNYQLNRLKKICKKLKMKPSKKLIEYLKSPDY